MSPAIRGRALIINTMHFYGTDQSRLGSDVDYHNLSTLFKDLRFEIVKSQTELTDLTAEVGLAVISLWFCSNKIV